MSKFKLLRNKLGMSRSECAKFLGLENATEVLKIEKNSINLNQGLFDNLAKLDSIVEAVVISEVDLFSVSNENEFILLRFLNDEDFALYEPDMFEDFGSVKIHRNFIDRAKKAIERIDGKVIISFMDSEFYEAWLGVNDFDDSRQLRVVWARQQLRGLRQ